MSHRSLFIAGAAIAAIIVSSAAYAQAPRPAAAQAKPVARTEVIRQLNANYKRLDSNGDGAVVAAEIQAAQGRATQAITAQFVARRNAAFKQLDTNKDGQLSPAEFNAGSPPPQLRPPAPATIIQGLDANKDQKVSPAEFSATRLANFDRVDTNRDGVASVEEQQKAQATRK